MDKKIYTVVILVVIVTSLSQTFAFISGDHQFYQTVQDKCTKCHGDIKIQLSTSANHSSILCSDCHTKSATNHTNKNPECKYCHNVSQKLNDTLEAHTGLASLYSDGCIACHTNYNTLVNYSRPEYIEYTISNKYGDWVISNITTIGMLNLSYNAMRQGGDHNIKDVSCKDCHKDIFDAVSTGGHAVVLAKNGTQVPYHNNSNTTLEAWCRTCHNRNDTEFPTQQHSVRKTTCEDCHEAYNLTYSGTTHPGNFFTSIQTVPHLYRSLICISCHSVGWPAPGGAIRFKVHEEPYSDVTFEILTPLSIVNSSPAGDPTTPTGTSQTFSITLDRTADIIWYNGGSEIFRVLGVTTSSYTKSMTSTGTYNITAVASDGYTSVSRSWNWSVVNQTSNETGGGIGNGGSGIGGIGSNSINGYVFDNNYSVLPGVLVSNGSYQNTTSESGYYLITNISSGTYNFSYYKAGFNTGYFEFTFSGAVVENMNIQLFDTTPPAPVSNTSMITGNFFVNNTWVNPADTDFNYTLFKYSNDTVLQSVNKSTSYLNLTWSPHYTQNISAQTVDNYSNVNPDKIWFNTTIPDNAPVQAPIGNKTVNEGEFLNFTVWATDADNDTVTYGTNATNGTFNTTTGNYSWAPNYGDAGFYYWSFNSSDGYGGISGENVAVTVNSVPLSITSASTLSDPNTTVGTPQIFSINLNRTANVIWYNSGSEVFSALNITSTSYTNSTAGVGVYNITAIASDGHYSVSRSWNWTVTAGSNASSGIDGGGGIGEYSSNSVSGYVFDSYGSGLAGVLVSNGSYQNTTSASGYYSITNISNGTYIFSYSKDGFNTDYFVFNLSGATIINANRTIYSAPSASISNINITTGNFFINNTWTNPADVNFNYTWFRYSNGTTLQNISKSTNYLNLTWSPHYTQNISAQTVDIYGTINQTLIWFNATIPDNLPVQAQIGNKTVNEGDLLTFTVSATDVDNDTITYGTNATKGTFNTTTGNYSWTPGYGDAGFYYWNLNSSDGYGGISSENIAVTVINAPLSITGSSPANDPTTTIGTEQTFGIALNRTADVTWYINGTAVQTNSSVISANYTNSTAGIGVYNITAIANDSYYTVSRIWNWTVTPQPTYNISGYVFDNYGSGLGDVLAASGSNQNITSASGYYMIAGLLNGTYNFSYSKAGFNTGYLEVAINGAGNNSANITIYDTIPPVSVSNPAVAAGNFYINNTWVNPADADFNHTWFRYSNGTNLQNVSSPINYLNLTWPPHYTQNISAETVDNYGNINQTIVWFNTTIPNNAPIQAQIGNKTVNEGESLNFTVLATDADNDTITYSTNATKGTFNTTTGNYSWTPGYGDAGFYYWSFNSSDGYGGISSENIAVTVINAPLSVTSSLPVSDPTTTAGTEQTFGIILNRTANVTWYINNSIVQVNSSVASAIYTNYTAGIGVYNVTAIADDGYYSVIRTWNWTVIAQPTYSVSGYVFDNYGSGLEGVLAMNGSNQNLTSASGYYLIAGLLNGTYNFSYSKAGFNTGYLEVTINGADNISANITIYDTVPPAQVTGLINDTPTQTTVNLTWNSTADASYYQVFRNFISVGYTKNTYWNDTALTPDTLYEYMIRANDSYNNWGQNSSILNVTTALAVDTTPPASVSNPATTAGSFYINNTWINPADADFNHTWFRYSNGTNLQNVSSPVNYLNLTWPPHYTQNISAQTIDTSGNINQTEVWFNATIPNNAPVQSLIGDKIVTAGNLLTFTVSATDADNDAITYGTNATKGSLNSTTGIYSWQTSSGDTGIYVWHFNSSDSYGGVASETITINVTAAPVLEYIPPVPANLTSTQGNFWINHTWQAGAGNVTDSYNVNVNGTWTNGTTNTYYNSTVGPHGWGNITVWAYNNSGSGSLSSTPVSQNIQVANNAPVQNAIGNKSVDEGQLLTFTVSATDADNDAIIYGTNATKGAFNTTTGQFSWTPSYGDAGTYIWYFNSSDSHGGIASETITITVNNIPLSIANSLPINDPTITAGTAQTFVVDLNRTANITWYIDGTAVQTNSSIVSANYTNSTAGIGVYNVTAIASDSYDSISRTWNWTVIAQPTYSVSGYVFDNYGSGLEGVLVQNNSKQNTTVASGYYLITGLPNGTYNFSYSKAGFNTGYLEITISGANINNANITIYDTISPASVSNPATAEGNFYINNTWVNPADADFSHIWFRYSNGTALQNVSSPVNYLNLTWQPHYTQNISAQAVDIYGNINQTRVWFNATIPNNAPVQSLIGDKTVTAGDLLTFTVSATDADSDIITYGTNATKGSLNSTTGVYSWQTSSGDTGIYVWHFNSSDRYGGVASETITINVTAAPVLEYIPPVPSNLTSTQGNFWVNHTWQAGSGNNTDSYNVNVNGTWTNGTTNTYYNSTVGPHGWSNITVWAYNNSGSGSLSSTPVSQNIQVSNNVPVQALIGNKAVNEGDPLAFTVSATDADNDAIIYGTNATKGTFNTTTGQFSWTPGYSDAGTYTWYFNSSDNYGGVASETITVTVNNIPLSITSFIPSGDPTTIAGTAQTFVIDLNRTANVAWYIDGTAVQTNSSVISAGYTNSTAGIGMHNVTAIANDSYDSATKQWNWNIIAQPTYNVSGYVFDNYGSGLGGVLVQNNSKQDTTTASGYYLITGLLNGTYNFSYSKAGFNTGYLEVTISGADINNANITIHDTTPPASVSSPATATGNFYINNTWINPVDADFNHAWFRYSNGTTLQNVSSPVNYLNLTWQPHYTQNISAQAVDIYGNTNQTMIWFNATIPNNAPVQSLIGDRTVTEGDLLTFTVSATDADSDIITYGTNATKGSLNSSTGVYSWQTSRGDAGTYVWHFNSSDGYGGIASETITVTVTAAPPLKYTPPDPANLQNTTGNFWVNHTWQAGSGNSTDSYNVSVNGVWYNGTSTFQNTTTAPHGWANITVWAYNSSGTGSLSAGSISQNTQVANNLPVQSTIGDKAVDEGQLLTFTVSATDADNDTITYGTNATKGTFNTATGEFSWTPGYGDAGTYIWYFNSNDGHGGIASETITVTVNNVPLSITSSSPLSDPATMQGVAQNFNIALNRTSNVIWYIDGSAVQTDSNVVSASYTNSTAGIGVHNITAIASDSYDSATKQWNWNVIAQPTYNVSGYVFDNYGSGLGGVLAQNGSKQSTTAASGYYLITGLLNGTYNFSYSKAGFNTGYLEITISGADNNNANITIYDTTPPASINNIAATYAPVYINWTWSDPANIDLDHVEVYIDGAFKSNVTGGIQHYNASYFEPNSTHTISTRTVDTYGNINATWVNNTATTQSMFTYVFGFLNTTGTVTGFNNAQSDSDGGASATFTESPVGGGSIDNYTYVTSSTAANGTVTNFVNMQSAGDSGAFARLTEGPANSSSQYKWVFSTTNESWRSNYTTTGGIVTMGFNATDGNPAGSIYSRLSNNNVATASTATTTWISPNFTWINGTPVSVRLDFNWKVATYTSGNTGNFYAVLVKPDGSSVQINMTTSFNAVSGWTARSNATISTSDFSQSGNYSLKLISYMRTTANRAGLVEVRWDNPTITLNYTSYNLNITTNTASVPADTSYYLEMNYSRDINGTGYDVYVFNGTAWNNRGSLISTAWTVFNISLSNQEYNGGNPSIRYIDKTPTGITQGNLFIDYQRIHGFTPVLSTYKLNITTNTTDIPDASIHTLQLGYNVSGDNFTLQIWNGSAWNDRAILNDTSPSYRNITLLPEELIPYGAMAGNAGSINRYYVLVRYLDLNASTAQQGKLYLDYQRVYSS